MVIVIQMPRARMHFTLSPKYQRWLLSYSVESSHLIEYAQHSDGASYVAALIVHLLSQKLWLFPQGGVNLIRRSA